MPPGLLRVALVSGFGALLLNLNATTLNVALRSLIADLHTTLDAAQWAVTGYLLALTMVLPLFRWSAERLGTRRLYISCLLSFTASSALCATAWSIGSLVAFRMVQGVVGGLLAPIAQSLAAEHAGPRHMGRMMSLVAIPVLVAPLLGPVVGGALVEALSWRWTFLLNVPLGVACAALCLRYLPDRDPAAPDVAGAPAAPRRAHLDVWGLALLSPGTATLVFGISSLRRGAGARTGAVVVPFVAAAVLLALFVWHAGRAKDRALVDLRLFRRRTVAAGTVTYVLAAIVTFGGQLLLPLYLEEVRGESPAQTGIWLVPQGIGTVIALLTVGRLADKHDPGKIAMGGVCLTLLGTLVLVRPSDHLPAAVLAASLVVRGVGLGATNLPGLSAVYRQMPKAEIANATAALNIVQRMGAPLGTALIAVVLEWRLGAASSRPDAFAQTFAASALFSALTAASATFLVGARAVDAARPETSPTPETDSEPRRSS